MLVVQYQAGFKPVGVHIQTRDGIAKATFERWEDGQCVDRNVIFDAPIPDVEAAMNGPIPPTATTPYEVVMTVLFGLALAAGRIGGRLISMSAPDPVEQVPEEPVQNTEDPDPPVDPQP